jgi:leucyl-tRNA synthetase
LGEDGNKMSKSRGNVVNPDIIVEKYGADALRLYEMFLGPLDAVKPWDSRGIGGMNRFLRRIWNHFTDGTGGPSPRFLEGYVETAETLSILNETIQRVREGITSLRFNTAIAQLMVLLNYIQRLGRLSRKTGQAFLQLLAPFAPHISEELWQRFGGTESIVRTPFPVHDPRKLSQDDLVIAVQVNGRLRGEVRVPIDANRDSTIRAAKLVPRVETHLREREIVKEIYVPRRLVNFVVR